MTRRKFIPALAVGGSLISGAEAKAPSIYEIRTIRLRNTMDNQRCPPHRFSAACRGARVCASRHRALRLFSDA